MASAHHGMRKSLAMGPSVRNLLTQYGLDPQRIQASGPHQTLLKGDVLAYLSKNNVTKPASSSSLTAAARPIAGHAPPQSRSKVVFSGADKVTVQRGLDASVAKPKYPRNYPSQQEIDVINNGGRVEHTPYPKPGPEGFSRIAKELLKG